jgi:hypothetical protein
LDDARELEDFRAAFAFDAADERVDVVPRAVVAFFFAVEREVAVVFFAVVVFFEADVFFAPADRFVVAKEPPCR